MANASDLYRSGKLAEAIAAQTEVVRSKPTDQPARLFLFELLSFAGELERAAKQVEALTLDEPELHLAALDYRNCLKSETARRQILSGGKPGFFMDPGPAAALRLEAFAELAAGNTAGFAAKLGEVNQAIPEVSGTLNGKPFSMLRDADDLFAGVFEVFAKGNYYWVPFEQVVSIATNPPKYPRDLLWLPANLTLSDGATGAVFLPGLYLGSHGHGLEGVRMGRERDWMPVTPDCPGLLRGYGPRVYLAGEDEVNLADIRELGLGS